MENFLAESVNQFASLVEKSDRAVKGITITGGEATQMSAACHDLALEHGAGIHVLLRANLTGSAMALLRVLYESTVKGTWLYRCASEKEIELYLNDKQSTFNVGQMVAAIESRLQKNSTTLSSFHKSNWKAMNSLTHSGIANSSLRFNANKIEANYPEKNVNFCIAAASQYVLLSALELANMAKSEKRAQAVVELSRQYSASY